MFLTDTLPPCQPGEVHLEELQKAILSGFLHFDHEMRSTCTDSSGATAVAAFVTPSHIIVANCGACKVGGAGKLLWYLFVCWFVGLLVCLFVGFIASQLHAFVCSFIVRLYSACSYISVDYNSTLVLQFFAHTVTQFLAGRPPPRQELLVCLWGLGGGGNSFVRYSVTLQPKS